MSQQLHIGSGLGHMQIAPHRQHHLLPLHLLVCILPHRLHRLQMFVPSIGKHHNFGGNRKFELVRVLVCADLYSHHRLQPVSQHYKCG